MDILRETHGYVWWWCTSKKHGHEHGTRVRMNTDTGHYNFLEIMTWGHVQDSRNVYK